MLSINISILGLLFDIYWIVRIWKKKIRNGTRYYKCVWKGTFFNLGSVYLEIPVAMVYNLQYSFPDVFLVQR